MDAKLEQVLALIQTIYQRPGSEQQWDCILRSFADLLKLQDCTLIAFDVARKTTWTLRSCGIDPKWVQAYDEHYGSTNPAFQVDITSMDPTEIVNSEKLPFQATLHASEFFHDFIRPQGGYHIFASVLAFLPPVTTVLSGQRPRRMRAFRSSDERLFEIISPHLANRIRLEEQIVRLEQAKRPLEQALEALDTACLVLDGRGVAIYANRPAERLLSQADGLVLTATGQLAAQAAWSAADLRRALRAAQAAAEAADVAGLRAPCLVAIERPSGRKPLLVSAFPCDASPPARTSAPGVLVLINDPEAHQDSLAQHLVQLWELTAQEARVGLQLLGGKSASQIAAEHQVSLNTVRTQIKSLLLKTDTRRQSEFIALVYRALGRSLG